MLKLIIVVVVFMQACLGAQVQVRGGELVSLEQVLYGRFEFRMRTAQGDGLLSNFFTFENDGWMRGSDNPWREIDIEVLGRYTDRFQTNIITGIAEDRITSEYYPRIDVNPHDNYYTYAIEWTPDYIAFFFEGEEMRRTEYGDQLNQVADCRDIPQSYRFNIWANNYVDWVGQFNPDVLPVYQFISWMRYYSYSTESGEFTLTWEDNFETFDSQRWRRADHVIEDYTQFLPANIIVRDGKLILALTDMDGTGLDEGDFTVPEDHDDAASVIFQNQNRAKGITRPAYELGYSENNMVIRQSSNLNSANIFDLRGRLQQLNGDNQRGSNFLR